MTKCPTCGTSFERKHKNKVYCSDSCKRKRKYNCSNCGKEVYRNKHNRKHTYCSMKCSSVHSGRTLKRTCKECSETFTAKKSAVSYGWGNYCSVDCHNKSMKKVVIKTCNHCGKKYEYSNGSPGKKYCSKKCSDSGSRRPIAKQVLEDLYVDKELTSREIADIIGRNKKVVIDYLRFHDIDVRPDGIKRRERIKCKDGHEVRSYYERAFDNMLYRNGIEHEHDVRLPANKRYMCDFKVQDVYIEIWGMMSWKTYRDNRIRKKALYEENNYKLLEVFPEDFKNIENKITELKRLIS